VVVPPDKSGNYERGDSRFWLFHFIIRQMVEGTTPIYGQISKKFIDAPVIKPVKML
jgi:hypothetical protein